LAYALEAAKERAATVSQVGRDTAAIDPLYVPADRGWVDAEDAGGFCDSPPWRSEPAPGRHPPFEPRQKVLVLSLGLFLQPRTQPLTPGLGFPAAHGIVATPAADHSE